MSEEKYLLSGVPISAWGLIKEASKIDHKFGGLQFKTTSMAAHILRQNGFVVKYNQEAPDGD